MLVINIEDKEAGTSKIIRPSEAFVESKEKEKTKQLIYELNRPTYGKSQY
jgi:hypothetical protein